MLALTRCKYPHIFCADCINRMLEINENIACPQCRTALTRNDIKIYGDPESFELNQTVLGRMSAKVEAVVQKAIEIIQDNQKVVIFTQFVRMIDLLRKFIVRDGQLGECVVELKGSQTPVQRNQGLQKFYNDPFTRVLICSTKVGGVGLNLTNATHCILVEPVTIFYFLSFLS